MDKKTWSTPTLTVLALEQTQVSSNCNPCDAGCCCCSYS